MSRAEFEYEQSCVLCPELSLKEAFELFDKNSDGRLSTKELPSVLRALGQNPTQVDINKVMQEADQDGNYNSVPNPKAAQHCSALCIVVVTVIGKGSNSVWRVCTIYTKSYFPYHLQNRNYVERIVPQIFKLLPMRHICFDLVKRFITIRKYALFVFSRSDCQLAL